MESSQYKANYSFNMNYGFSEEKGGGLPDFLIVGAQKCGTTALCANLDKHPEIFLAKRAGPENAAYEFRFFVNNAVWQKGETWYRSLFPYTDLVQGEKTPEYLDHFVAHERMHKIVPNAKLIVLVRNPVDRAYSAWNHFMQSGKYRRQGWKKESFEAALAESFRGENDSFRAIVEKGVYIKQIRNLLRYYDRSQLFIGIAEKFKREPVAETRKVFEFLGVTPMDVEAEHRHVRKYSSPMKDTTRELLENFYEPYNEELYDFLGYRIDDWQ